MVKYYSVIFLMCVAKIVIGAPNDDDNLNSKSDVLFCLYTSNNSSYVKEERLIENSSVILNSEYNSNKPTKFLIHGWTHEKDTPWLVEMREVMSFTKKWNVIVVDWSSMSHLSYVKSREKTKTVGRKLAKFVIFLRERNFIKLPRIHFIGHSLGSHIAGFGAQIVKDISNQTIARITGLDPAGPGFEYGNRTNSRDKRLDDQDAKFVDVIHTNGRILGMLNPVGHVDFYPNGGVTQPGCNSYVCSHLRACEFMTASVTHPDAYRAYRYKSWNEYIDQRIHEGRSVPMGMKASPIIPPGTYFLETASEIPYLHYKTKHIHSL